MDAVDIAWVAGIIEGEGWIGLRGSQRQCHINVSMTDEDIIRRLHETTGEGHVGFTPMRGNMTKPQWLWRVSDKRGVARVLCAIAPLLGVRRREQVAKVADQLAVMRTTAKPSDPIAHGTVAGYQRERRQGLPSCDACRSANTAHHRAYNLAYKRRRAALSSNQGV